jgi:predicted NodU family carbamoyl transferase
MKKISSRFSIAFAVLLAFSVFFSSPVIATETTTVTIVGEVNDQYQIVTKDGTIYEIADTETGDQVLQFIGSVVEVTGQVEEDDGVKIIDVKSFKPKEE